MLETRLWFSREAPGQQGSLRTGSLTLGWNLSGTDQQGALLVSASHQDLVLLARGAEAEVNHALFRTGGLLYLLLQDLEHLHFQRLQDRLKQALETAEGWELVARHGQHLHGVAAETLPLGFIQQAGGAPEPLEQQPDDRTGTWPLPSGAKFLFVQGRGAALQPSALPGLLPASGPGLLALQSLPAGTLVVLGSAEPVGQIKE